MKNKNEFNYLDSAIFTAQLGKVKKNKIVLSSEFDINLLPSSWISVERFTDKDGLEKVMFWYEYNISL